MHSGLLSYRFLKEMSDGGNVIYLDRRNTPCLTAAGLDALAKAAAERAAASCARLAESFMAREREQVEAPQSKVAAEPVKPAEKHGKRDPFDAITLGRDVDWTRPGGLLGWITDWTLSQMRRPNRPLAVAAAVATMAPVCGWRNIYSPTGCSLNLYIAALAPTAVGKDAMLKAPGRILKTVGTPKRLYSSSDAFSLSAQEKILYDHRSIVLTLDEVATNLFPRMFGVRASAHESSLKGMHMKLWERNLGDPGYGFTARGPNSQVQYEDLYNPSFSMLVANTPATFWESLPKEAIANGYLNRWLLVAAAPRESQDVVHSEAPEEIVDSLHEIANADVAGKLVLPGGATPYMLPWADDGARDAWTAMESSILLSLDDETPTAYLMARTAEYTVRLASLHAIGCRGPHADVAMADLHWGASLAMASARLAIENAHRIGGGDYPKLLAAIEGYVRKRKTATRQEIANVTRGCRPKDRNDALGDLVGMERLRAETKPALYRWIGE